VFDFRYHVASLAAVFIALVIGILVGVGLSGRGFVNDAERKNLQSRIADLERQRDAARQSADAGTRNQLAVQGIAQDTYGAVVPGRLKGHRVAVLYIGAIDQPVDFSVKKGVHDDGGGTIVRVRQIHVPIRDDAIRAALQARPALRHFAGARNLTSVGRELGTEFVRGVHTPLWAALANVLVDEREGDATPPVDGVVVVRTAPPQAGSTARFLYGLYQGLARAGAPAVGIERAGVDTSALPVLARAGLSTVGAVDDEAGRLALVLLLAGAQPGHYGIDKSGKDGVIPPVPATPAG
jgi:Copper transport outer membrane protein, MctB